MNSEATPVLFVPGWHNASRPGMSLVARAGIPTFTIPDRAVRVVAEMGKRGQPAEN